MNKYTVAVAAIAAAMLVAWLGYPWTKSQCYRWAAERRGDLAIAAAVGMCVENHGKLNTAPR